MTYIEDMVRVYQSQIKTLQEKIEELEAKLEICKQTQSN